MHIHYECGFQLNFEPLIVEIEMDYKKYLTSSATQSGLRLKKRISCAYY